MKKNEMVLPNHLKEIPTQRKQSVSEQVTFQATPYEPGSVIPMLKAYSRYCNSKPFFVCNFKPTRVNQEVPSHAYMLKPGI